MEGISVVICCYNSATRLPDTLAHLSKQLVRDIKWEILIINNNSTDNTKDVAVAEWSKYKLPQVGFRVIDEYKSGLSFARKKGIENARYDILIFCDDDNHLCSNYLNEAYTFFAQYDNIGVAGGKSLPKYETPPPQFFLKSGVSLGCRDKGDEILISSCNKVVKEYPEMSPIGSGMVLRKEVGVNYVQHLNNGSVITDRKGESLSSGGDNEINLIALIRGWEVAYNPKLVLNHLIPSQRLTVSYLSRMSYESSRSWVILLKSFNICPWTPISKWSVAIRKIRAYFRLKPWASELNYIKYCGVCGQFDGLAVNYKIKKANHAI